MLAVAPAQCDQLVLTWVGFPHTASPSSLASIPVRLKAPSAEQARLQLRGLDRDTAALLVRGRPIQIIIAFNPPSAIPTISR